uniref:RING-type E3 ubiquitin transferase n=1 Tax=Ananas comosus var. bracteatus TaxID=296719 RepID=A0A6V7NFA4_ANACO|nr:unnamed protein product [Ananas comosus var. bracteatus]
MLEDCWRNTIFTSMLSSADLLIKTEPSFLSFADSFTIFYFAKEERNCSFSQVYPDMGVPVKIPFRQGLAQRFRQPPGSGIDLGFFELNELSKPLNGDIFPLVIYAEAYPSTLQKDELTSQSTIATCAQITQAVVEKANDGAFQVKVQNQILWVDGERYELQEIFGLCASSAESEVSVDNSDTECVICMSEPKDTAVLPCRHMCMCRECAKALRLQSNKCPICRQPIETILEIQVAE